MLKNHMEDVVEHVLPTIIHEYNDICKCDKCMDDIKAIALNNLKPAYIVTDKGNAYTKVNELISQFNVDVMNEITKAVEIVSKNSKHEL